MAKRLDELVQLYPIHPAYLEKFELISIAEKREILKTLSAEMRRLLILMFRKQTGLVSYDSYWSHLRENPSKSPTRRSSGDRQKCSPENRIKQALLARPIPTWRCVSVMGCRCIA